MMIFIDGKQVENSSSKIYEDKEIFSVADLTEKQEILSEFHFEVPDKTKISATYFGSYADFDYMVFSVPKMKDAGFITEQIEIYFSKEKLLIFNHDSDIVKNLIQYVQSKAGEGKPLEKILYKFFSILMDQHVMCLEKIEDQVADLEDAVVADKQMNYVKSISKLRKNLLTLKRYYESLSALIEDLEENSNGILSDNILNSFHFQARKADRLYLSILHLRDYLTQVREAYQAQMDIELNKTMKLVTGITAIFLPLSLIAGWYGMNLAMPETRSVYTYPIVIGVSIIIFLGCVAYFKKNKWF